MTNMHKYLKNVANPADITGTSKKWEYEFTAKETVIYKKTLEIIAQDEDDAQDTAEQMCEDNCIDFDDTDEYDTEGFDEIECECVDELD